MPTRQKILSIKVIILTMAFSVDMVFAIGRPRAEVEALLAGYQKQNAFSTHISSDMIDQAREIIETEDWAGEAFASIKATADYWMAMTDDQLYDIIPTQNPLAYTPGYSFGSPVCGVGDAWNTTGALRTSMETPNMWQCATCGTWFGPGVEFEYGGNTFAITDNGAGWVAPHGLPSAGHRFYFTAAWRQYVFFALFGSSRGRELSRPGHLEPIGALDAMATVYAITGEEEYARKALLILARVAELHPDFQGAVDIGYAALMPHLGWTTAGAEDIVDTAVYTYDIVFDYLYKADGLVEFLREKGYADMTGDGDITHRDIQRSVEVNLFGYMYDWLLRVRSNYRRTDNWTLTQSAQMTGIGRVLENPGIVHEAIEGHNGFRQLMRQQTLNDGRHFYNSLPYHNHMPFLLKDTYFRAHGYYDGDIFKEPIDLFADENLPFSRMVDFTAGIWSGGFIPNIGDGGASRRKKDFGNEYILSFHADLILPYPHLAEQVRDSDLFLDEVKAFLDPDHHSFFPRNILKAIVDFTEIKNIIEDTAYQPQKTRLFTDSGLAILRTDDDGLDQNHVVLNYGIGGRDHGHRDHLALNIIAYGYQLTMNKGYPYTFRGATNKVRDWLWNTGAQKTVRINGENQIAHDLLNIPLKQAAGRLHAFVDNETVAIVDGSNENVYSGTADLYRRTVFLIKNADQPFIVDFFNVTGGTVRDYQFYGQSDVNGENFEIALKGGNGMQNLTQPPAHIDGRFMYDLAQAEHSDEFTARWWIGDEDNTGLLMHMLASENGRKIITGKGQGEGSDRPVPCDVHVIVREQGNKPSRFTSLFFAYQGVLPEYSVEQLATVSPANGSAVGLSVYKGTKRYLIFHDLDGKQSHVFSDGENSYTFQGIAGVIVEKAGDMESVTLARGTLLGQNKSLFENKLRNEGRIVSVEEEQRSVTVKGMDYLENREIPYLIGLTNKPWSYRVVDTEATEEGLRLYLDTFSTVIP